MVICLFVKEIEMTVCMVIKSNCRNFSCVLKGMNVWLETTPKMVLESFTSIIPS